MMGTLIYFLRWPTRNSSGVKVTVVPPAADFGPPLRPRSLFLIFLIIADDEEENDEGPTTRTIAASWDKKRKVWKERSATMRKAISRRDNGRTNDVAAVVLFRSFHTSPPRVSDFVRDWRGVRTGVHECASASVVLPTSRLPHQKLPSDFPSQQRLYFGVEFHHPVDLDVFLGLRDGHG